MESVTVAYSNNVLGHFYGGNTKKKKNTCLIGQVSKYLSVIRHITAKVTHFACLPLLLNIIKHVT